MEKISLKLKNCYGISELNQDLVFQENGCNIISIYAPNGTMKSSLAKTISDIVNSNKYKESKDKIIESSEYERNIIFNNQKIENKKNEVLVLNSFQSEEENLVASVLLVVDEKIKNEYKEKLDDYLELKKDLFKNIYLKIENKKRVSKDYNDVLKNKIGTIFKEKFEKILIENNYEKNLNLINIKQDLNNIKNAFKISDLVLIFSSDFKEKIINKNLLKNFIEYMETLKKASEKSVFFSGSISFHKSKSYSDNKDIIGLLKDWNLEHKNKNININSKEEFDNLYEKEREKILKGLNKKEEFNTLNKNVLSKNNEDILENFNNLKLLKIINEIGYEDLEKFYYLNLIEEEKNSINWQEDYSNFLNTEKEIIKDAKEKITLLEQVIEQFNNKFDMPIYIKLDDREEYIIGKKEEDIINLKLVHKDNENFEDEKHIYSTLSTGQKKALYLLKTLFKIEELKFKNKDKDKECLIVIDDLSESFDYKNKNALLSYIYDLNLINNFKILSMTHNFDFFRSLSKRLNIGKNKYIATRNNNEIKIFNYKQNLSFKSFYNGINSIESFFLSIPILRENIEEKENKNEIDILTKSLHYKKSTLNIKNKDILDLEVIKKVIKEESIIDNIREQNYIETLNNITKKIISDEINDNNIKNYIFSNKIILCIAIRIKAEEILKEEMNLELNDDKNQLGSLFKEYQNYNNKNLNIEKKIKEAVLSVPELIHFNSEDYLIIIDLSFDYLKNIYLNLIN